MVIVERFGWRKGRCFTTEITESHGGGDEWL
jgi:hypothetical protein